MFNDKLNYFIEAEAKKNARNKEYYLPIIQSRVLLYIKQYINFINDNTKKLKEYIEIKNKDILFDEDKNFSSKKLWSLLIFLKGGQDLVDSDLQISKNGFAKYKQIASPQESENRKEFVTYAEKKLGLKGIKKLHDYLQFVLALYKIEDIRIEYCKEILTNMWKEKENLFEEKKLKQEEKIFNSNIWIQGQNNQYNYSHFMFSPFL